MFIANKLDVYHTTDNRGNHVDLIAQKGVFADLKDLFLGRGYYYWEGNFDLAKKMGITKYKGNYYIFNGKLTLDHNKLLNLSLNNHLGFLLAQGRFLRRSGKNITIGNLIDYILDKQNEALLNGDISENELFFPFFYSIAIDSTQRPLETIAFTNRIVNFINSKPESIICVYHKKDLSLEDFNLIKQGNGSE